MNIFLTIFTLHRYNGFSVNMKIMNVLVKRLDSFLLFLSFLLSFPWFINPLVVAESVQFLEQVESPTQILG